MTALPSQAGGRRRREAALGFRLSPGRGGGGSLESIRGREKKKSGASLLYLYSGEDNTGWLRRELCGDATRSRGGGCCESRTIRIGRREAFVGSVLSLEQLGSTDISIFFPRSSVLETDTWKPASLLGPQGEFLPFFMTTINVQILSCGDVVDRKSVV